MTRSNKIDNLELIKCFAKKEVVAKIMKTKDLKTQKPKKKQIKVLLIEDNEAIVEMYKIKLVKKGMNVDIAKNGLWGIKSAKAEKYDAIVLDLVMPVANGHAALKSIRKSVKNKLTPVIVLSNSGQERDIEKAKKCGASCYLLKSNITPSKLVSEIENYIHQKKEG